MAERGFSGDPGLLSDTVFGGRDDEKNGIGFGGGGGLRVGCRRTSEGGDKNQRDV